jgi:hypothetical protein
VFTRAGARPVILALFVHGVRTLRAMGADFPLGALGDNMGKINPSRITFVTGEDGKLLPRLDGTSLVKACDGEPAWLLVADRGKVAARVAAGRWVTTAVAEAHGSASAARDAIRAERAEARGAYAEAHGLRVGGKEAVAAFLDNDGRSLPALIPAVCGDWDPRSLRMALALEGANGNRKAVKSAFQAVLSERGAAKKAAATAAPTPAPAPAPAPVAPAPDIQAMIAAAVAAALAAHEAKQAAREAAKEAADTGADS